MSSSDTLFQSKLNSFSVSSYHIRLHCTSKIFPDITKKHLQNVSAFFLEVTPGFEPGNQGFADPCLTTWLCHHFEKDALSSASFSFGADDEARTRYLHLGKVALYQMSYGRILITFLRYRGPRKDLRSKGLWGEGENLVFITEVLLARLPDE